MLNITRKSLTLEPEEVMELERIITDEDREAAFQFIRKVIYRRLVGSQENRLKCHLDGEADPAESFAEKKKS